MGYIFAILAGSAMSIQGVMNTRLGEKTGLLLSNSYVQGTAFILALIALIFAKDNNFKGFGEVNKIYLFGGVLGLVITLTVMLSVKKLSPVLAVSVILIAQLITAAVIEGFGLMESEKIAFTWNKIVGVIAMIGGVILFKYTG